MAVATNMLDPTVAGPARPGHATKVRGRPWAPVVGRAPTAHPLTAGLPAAPNRPAARCLTLPATGSVAARIRTWSGPRGGPPGLRSARVEVLSRSDR